MAINSPRMGLKIWNLVTDPYDHAQLASNWAKVDEHNHTEGKGVQIPTGGIEDGAITAEKIANGAVPSFDLENEGVTTEKIASEAVTTAKIDSEAITSALIKTGTIKTADIEAAQITAGLLASNAVTTAKIAKENVITEKIANSAITSEKLGGTLAGYLGITTSTSVARGHLITSTEQSTESTSFTTLSTVDQVTNVVVPTNGILCVSFNALWKVEKATGNGGIAIFIGANQATKLAKEGAPANVEATLADTGVKWGIVQTAPSSGLLAEATPTGAGSESSMGTAGTVLAPVEFQGLEAGTYTIQIRYKTGTGSGSKLFVKDRNLYVWTRGY